MAPRNQLKQPKIGQERRTDNEKMLFTALGKIDKHAETLEDCIGALSSELDMDMEARSVTAPQRKRS